ncbi:hypothetical protein CRUP_008430 [Coryphaenoides rupestris]|nr:hypothetical protein CRUP_008430 [Coryphaenoides rupestris]
MSINLNEMESSADRRERERESLNYERRSAPGGNVMEDQDLRDMGITDPGHRKKILHAARSFPKSSGDFLNRGLNPARPLVSPVHLKASWSETPKHLNCSTSLATWLDGLGLHEYLPNFLSSGYRTLDCVKNLWELEIINTSTQKTCVLNTGFRHETSAVGPLADNRSDGNRNSSSSSSSRSSSGRRMTVSGWLAGWLGWLAGWLAGLGGWIALGPQGRAAAAAAAAARPFGNTAAREARPVAPALRHRAPALLALQSAAVIKIGPLGHRKRIIASLAERPYEEAPSKSHRLSQIMMDPYTSRSMDMLLPLSEPGRRRGRRDDQDCSVSLRSYSERPRSVDRQSERHKDSRVNLRPPSNSATYATYLGSMIIRDLRGIESTQDACAKIRTIVAEHEIRNISCAAQDPDDLRSFAYITKDLKSGHHFCHVFSTVEVTQTYEIILTLGQAFEVAYQLAVQSRARQYAPPSTMASEVIETKASRPVSQSWNSMRRSTVSQNPAAAAAAATTALIPTRRSLRYEVIKIGALGHRKRIIASLAERPYEEAPSKSHRLSQIMMDPYTSRSMDMLLPLSEPGRRRGRRDDQDCSVSLRSYSERPRSVDRQSERHKDSRVNLRPAQQLGDLRHGAYITKDLKSGHHFCHVFSTVEVRKLSLKWGQNGLYSRLAERVEDTFWRSADGLSGSFSWSPSCVPLS